MLSAALLPDRLLDGHQPGRRDAGFVHERYGIAKRISSAGKISVKARLKA